MTALRLILAAVLIPAAAIAVAMFLRGAHRSRPTRGMLTVKLHGRVTSGVHEPWMN